MFRQSVEGRTVHKENGCDDMAIEKEFIITDEKFPFKLFLFEGSAGYYKREIHWHRMIEIFAVSEGQLIFYIDNAPRSLKSGEFVIVNSNELHSIYAPSPNHTIVLQFPLELISGNCKSGGYIRFSHEKNESDPKVMDLIEQIYDRNLSRTVEDRVLIYSLFYRLCHIILSDYQINDDNKELSSRFRTLDKLSNITWYMEQNYKEPLTLQMLGEYFGYSPEHLSRMFSKYAGTTFKDMLREIRLNHILYDLEDDTLTLDEICTMHGFSNCRAMARAVKKKFGVNPSEYRRQRKG